MAKTMHVYVVLLVLCQMSSGNSDKSKQLNQPCNPDDTCSSTYHPEEIAGQTGNEFTLDVQSFLEVNSRVHLLVRKKALGHFAVSQEDRVFSSHGLGQQSDRVPQRHAGGSEDANTATTSTTGTSTSNSASATVTTTPTTKFTDNATTAAIPSTLSASSAPATTTASPDITTVTLTMTMTAITTATTTAATKASMSQPMLRTQQNIEPSLATVPVQIISGVRVNITGSYLDEQSFRALMVTTAEGSSWHWWGAATNSSGLAAMPYELRHASHSKSILRSLPFYIAPSSSISVTLSGGLCSTDNLAGQAAVLTGTAEPTGFLGVALRDVATNTWLLSRTRVSKEISSNEVVFGPTDLRGHTGRLLTLDFIDSCSGSMGWITFRSLKVDGAYTVVTPRSAKATVAQQANLSAASSYAAIPTRLSTDAEEGNSFLSDRIAVRIDGQYSDEQSLRTVMAINPSNVQWLWWDTSTGNEGLAAVEFDVRDAAHRKAILRTRPFYVTNATSIQVTLKGGMGGTPSIAGKRAVVQGDTDLAGFLGVALRDVASNAWLLSKTRSSSGGPDEVVEFKAGELQGLVGNLVTLDFVDSFSGLFGWIAFTMLKIHGTSSHPLTGSNVSASTTLASTTLTTTASRSIVSASSTTLASTTLTTTISGIIFSASTTLTSTTSTTTNSWSTVSDSTTLASTTSTTTSSRSIVSESTPLASTQIPTQPFARSIVSASTTAGSTSTETSIQAHDNTFSSTSTTPQHLGTSSQPSGGSVVSASTTPASTTTQISDQPYTETYSTSTTSQVLVGPSATQAQQEAQVQLDGVYADEQALRALMVTNVAGAPWHWWSKDPQSSGLAAVPYELRDLPHPKAILRSLPFHLRSNATINLTLNGGSGGTASLAGQMATLQGNADPTGFLGVALRDVSTNTWLLSKTQATSINHAVSFDSRDLQSHTGKTLTLDFVDSCSGSAGWVAVKSLEVRGAYTVLARPTAAAATPASPAKSTTRNPFRTPLQAPGVVSGEPINPEAPAEDSNDAASYKPESIDGYHGDEQSLRMVMSLNPSSVQWYWWDISTGITGLAAVEHEVRNAAHKKAILRSRPFYVTQSTTIKVSLKGGMGAATSIAGRRAAMDGDADLTGFLGIALQDVGSNTWLMSKTKCTSGGPTEVIEFNVTDLQGHVGKLVTLDFVDSFSGNLGWIAVEVLEAHGTSSLPVSTLTPTPQPTAASAPQEGTPSVSPQGPQSVPDSQMRNIDGSYADEQTLRSVLVFSTPGVTWIWRNSTSGREGLTTNQSAILRSRPFTLTSHTSIKVTLSGGVVGTGSLAGKKAMLKDIVDTGCFRGLALRDVATDTWLLSKTRSSTGSPQEVVELDFSDILPYTDKVVTLDFIDSCLGYDGAVAISKLSVSGTQAAK